MDSEDDDRNLYVSAEVWKRLVTWYGVSANHQLSRRSSAGNDEKVERFLPDHDKSSLVSHIVFVCLFVYCGNSSIVIA
jgi:hypothetical protein